ncbi:hypothetical protein COU62_03620 [Candidatus Pacearchaeota archaeon CG10_big_fil_rev_8_21_14_0_10_35_219]|nr:hypothetical protein [Candidatus Pacearchaeota archaeon]OIO42325.1 MAG: hypothetical protein AUJ63_03555 [Candidatus Pacearchaeota archaeon CG1_02_35_32]PIO07440.1 MAG: hypothetical protein COU62_03620 [Candidatus Pacearchaeota archaeon CG10_big_fil_rev_8_21_14_0_10_35_219]PIY81246.1 MAG: hypothetical protein COY79_03115 [Candidatus Pacearchaeota archaeon CG_4_10_14_0_8_um_filter_35_169]PIZ80175.1 MAG: hypothetical protein COY00_01760 [Candidatus Pacearchaeota archaeon CG_4_10_14_0_2_um_filt
MVNQADYTYQLQIYIKKNLKKGYQKETLRQALINQGHSIRSIEKAFEKVEKEMIRKAPVLKTKPKITYERIEPEEKKSFWKKLFD